MVPERTSEMETYGYEGRKQNGGEVLSGWVAGDGHVPRADGLNPVVASAQSALQRDGRPAEPQLDGLSIATILRLMSALQLNIRIIRSVLTISAQ